jgi:hypothetical protein
MDAGFACDKTIFVGEATECTPVTRCLKNEDGHSEK